MICANSSQELSYLCLHLIGRFLDVFLVCIFNICFKMAKFDEPTLFLLDDYKFVLADLYVD
jgi:hypothetical protein